MRTLNPDAQAERAIEIVPGGKPLRWRRYDVPQHLAPETSDALRFCAVEGDLDLLDRRHRSTIERHVRADRVSMTSEFGHDVDRPPDVVDARNALSGVERRGVDKRRRVGDCRRHGHEERHPRPLEPHRLLDESQWCSAEDGALTRCRSRNQSGPRASAPNQRRVASLAATRCAAGHPVPKSSVRIVSCACASFCW